MFQQALHDIVIVAVAGIDRDIAAIRAIEQGQRIGFRRVGQAEADDAAGVWPQGLRVGALVGAVR